MSYGAQFFNAGGVAVLEGDETMSRVVFSQRIGGSASGTLSVPDFDSTRGMAYLAFFAAKYDPDGPTIRGDAADWYTVTDGEAYPRLVSNIYLPSISWDNTAKTFTYAPHSLGAGIFNTPLIYPDYRITCVHFR